MQVLQRQETVFPFVGPQSMDMDDADRSDKVEHAPELTISLLMSSSAPMASKSSFLFFFQLRGVAKFLVPIIIDSKAKEV